ncbi:UDP-glycosyltransferase 74e2 [Phtheirospermum japonicum]|uniref:Glycosyltransferase n=1 Tax=Phtheirospermum japonicum TaxID=374723 RepID=A0A830CMM6_9LAMI|nr:UDP-glycosyltransferase 74e2 [Phtheirospermum japonicum]
MVASKPHVYVFPFPVQSHINPMLEFSKSLASNDQLNVTFIITTKIMTNSKSNINNNITIESISDGSEEEAQEPQQATNVDHFFKNFEAVVSKNLTKFIEQQKQALNGSPKLILVYDSVFPWMLDMAHKLNMIGASFFTQSCAVTAIYYQIKQGCLRFPFKEGFELPDFLPALGIDDLPKVLGSNHALVRILADQFSNLDKADFLLFNTFEKLENKVVEWMATQWPIKTIGPTNLLVQKDNITPSHKNNHMINLFESNDQEAYTKWLDSKETNSVIYVSFGSLVNLDESQMEELAMGLVMSQCNFLWVVRASEEHKLPPNFANSLSPEKGIIVNWCSQTEILAHRSVSCFLTHGGWNSTMEGVSSGVPLIVMPQWVDQTTNAKFIEGVWGVGVRVRGGENGMVSRDEVCKCVKEVGDKGKEIRSNAKMWNELAKEAVDDGGTTTKNIEDIVSRFLSV